MERRNTTFRGNTRCGRWFGKPTLVLVAFNVGIKQGDGHTCLSSLPLGQKLLVNKATEQCGLQEGRVERPM